jgi:hypothetical protein
MPYKMYKLQDRDAYRVKNTETGDVLAKKTTKAKAEAQIRLLRGIEHGTLKPRK